MPRSLQVFCFSCLLCDWFAVCENADEPRPSRSASASNVPDLLAVRSEPPAVPATWRRCRRWPVHSLHDPVHEVHCHKSGKCLKLKCQAQVVLRCTLTGDGSVGVFRSWRIGIKYVFFVLSPPCRDASRETDFRSRPTTLAKGPWKTAVCQMKRDLRLGGGNFVNLNFGDFYDTVFTSFAMYFRLCNFEILHFQASIIKPVVKQNHQLRVYWHFNYRFTWYIFLNVWHFTQLVAVGILYLWVVRYVVLILWAHHGL
jgi:hypothetical protein